MPIYAPSSEFREVTLMVLAFVATALLGFAVGLFSFKVKLRWCRECGALLTCPECSHPGAHVVIRRPS